MFLVIGCCQPQGLARCHRVDAINPRTKNQKYNSSASFFRPAVASTLAPRIEPCRTLASSHRPSRSADITRPVACQACACNKQKVAQRPSPNRRSGSDCHEATPKHVRQVTLLIQFHPIIARGQGVKPRNDLMRAASWCHRGMGRPLSSFGRRNLPWSVIQTADARWKGARKRRCFLLFEC